MWIVYYQDGSHHSAWAAQADAEGQAQVLHDHGYGRCTVAFDGTVVCEDGHYYV